MEFNLKPGISHTSEKIAAPTDSAEHYGSGLVPVFSTPAMIALMENAAMNAVLPLLPDGFNTVGIEICVKHVKATAIGAHVKCVATLDEVQGKKLRFSLLASDNEGLIGEGTHTRYIINTTEFLKRLEKGT